jgi:hypothetical protein
MDDWNIADLDATYQLTADLSSVDSSRIGIMGRCYRTCESGSMSDTGGVW